MKSDPNIIQFEILNERFTIRSTVPKDYYLRLVEYLRGKIKRIRERVPKLSGTKLLIFAALDIADELMKEKDKSFDENEIQLLSDLSDSLASAIDDTD
jgi:cell division protein ZapA (FtsZ GTPase activity inhibitor)